MPKSTASPTTATSETRPRQAGVIGSATSKPWRMLGVAALLTGMLAVGAAIASAGLSTGRFTASGTESARVQRALAEQFGVHPASLMLRVQDDVDSPSVAAQGARLTRQLTGEAGVAHGVSYWTTGAPELRAKDGHAALIAIESHSPYSSTPPWCAGFSSRPACNSLGGQLAAARIPVTPQDQKAAARRRRPPPHRCRPRSPVDEP